MGSHHGTRLAGGDESARTSEARTDRGRGARFGGQGTPRAGRDDQDRQPHRRALCWRGYAGTVDQAATELSDLDLSAQWAKAAEVTRHGHAQVAEVPAELLSRHQELTAEMRSRHLLGGMTPNWPVLDPIPAVAFPETGTAMSIALNLAGALAALAAGVWVYVAEGGATGLVVMLVSMLAVAVFGWRAVRAPQRGLWADSTGVVAQNVYRRHSATWDRVKSVGIVGGFYEESLAPRLHFTLTDGEFVAHHPYAEPDPDNPVLGRRRALLEAIRQAVAEQTAPQKTDTRTDGTDGAPGSASDAG